MILTTNKAGFFNMKKRPTKIFLLLAGLIVLGIASITLRTVTMLTAFDSQIGYYDDVTITGINRIFSIATVLYGAIIILLIDRSSLPTPGKSQTVISISFSMVAAFAFVMAAVLIGIIFIADPIPLNFLVLISLILSAAYFIYRGTRRSDPTDSPMSLLALAPIICCFTIILIEMFDMYVPINGPEKLCLTFALMSAALFILEMAKSDAGSTSPKLLLFSAYVSCFLCGYSAIPGLIASITKVTGYTKYVIYYFIVITMLLFIAGYLFDYIRVLRLSSKDEE